MTKDINTAFREFHFRNPVVFNLFMEFCEEALATGQKIGAKAIWERMRWEINMNPTYGEYYKCNNNYTSRYARMAIAKNPKLASLFEIRRIKSEV